MQLEEETDSQNPIRFFLRERWHSYVDECDQRGAGL